MTIRFEIAEGSEDLAKRRITEIAQLELSRDKFVGVEEKRRLERIVKARLDSRRRFNHLDPLVVKADKIIAKLWLCETVGEALVIMGAVMGDTDGILAVG